MNIKELESLLQGNRIDLRNLNAQQKIFIDTLQKNGVIEVPPFEVMLNKQNEAAKEVAKQKELVADPIRSLTSDKVNRDNVQMITDIGFLTAQLFFDRKRLAGAILNPNKYIKDINKISSNFKNPILNRFVSGLKAISGAAKGFGSVAAQSAVRSAIAGTLGYTAGGIAYDLADEIARDQLDLKKAVGDKTYKDYLEQNKLLRVVDDFRVGLTFNAGAELLGPMAADAAYGIRKLFGLETPYSRAMAEISKANNFKATYIMLADPNTAGGKILKGINRIFGQLPYIGGPAKEAQLGAIKQFNDMSAKIFELQPGMHLATAAMASEKAASQVLKQYEKFMTINKINFNRFANQARAFGDPRVIDLNHVKQYMDSIRRDALAPPEIKQGFLRNEMFNTPFGRFFSAYQDLVRLNRPISITEYAALRTLLNQTTAQLSKSEPMQTIYTQLQKSLEMDFAKMDLAPTREITLRENVATEDMIKQGGNLVQAEVKSTVGQTGLTEAKKLELKKNIEEAFGFYANNIKTFESLTARKLAAFDANALSYKQIIGFQKAGSVERDQLLKTISRNIFQTKNNLSFNAITDLQKLMDADVHAIKPIKDAQGNTTFQTKLIRKGSKEGNETLRNLWGSHVGQAYQMSFRPIEKNQMGDWVSSWLSREQDKALKGDPYQSLDEMLMPNGLPAKNLSGGNVYFDPDIFRKIVLPNEAAATQMKVIFGSEKANQLLKSYDDLLSYMDAVKSYTVPEASTFLARRLVLSGPNIAVGAGAYGMGFFPMALTLFLGNRANRILSDPNAANVINSAFKSFLEQPGKYGGLSTFTRFQLAKVANALLNDYVPDDFKFDESDASMMEIFKILDATKSPIEPLTDLNMNKEEEENLFPKLTEAETLKAIDDMPDPEFLTEKIGGLPANMEEEAMMARAINTMPENVPITPTTLPRQQGLRIPGPGITPIDYGALFPFDSLGNLIRDRRQT